MKQVYIDADKPKEDQIKQGNNTMFLDKANLTARIYRDQKTNIWAQISGRAKLDAEMGDPSDQYAGIPNISPHAKLATDVRSEGLIVEETEEARAIVEDKINNSFSKNHLVKRRDPSHYIRNPAKVYVSTLGKKHYAINEMAKETFLTKVGRNSLNPKDLLPNAPNMRT